MISRQIGILHPGEMGARVAAAARSAGAKVSWVSNARGDASRQRASEAGLDDAGSLEVLAAHSDLIISVCPPEAATSLAEAVADTGFAGIFVDANAVSSATARAIAVTVETAGARFVDGGIIGPPPSRAGTTRLYLSGDDASSVAKAFEGSALEAVVIGSRAGEASAVKVCYAAWTKGSAALLTSIRALALAEGVEAALLEEWSISQPGLEARSAASARNNAFKAWRFTGEMREIAATFAAAGLPDGFHAGAADIYERLAVYKNCDPAPELAQIMETLAANQA